MFTHLHAHTEYSLLDGLCKFRPLVQRCKELGMEALAVTDHGALYGAPEFFLECQEAGIKPIIGCELYVARSDRLSHAPSEKTPFHLTVLAKNNEGYHNLIQLVTKAHLEGFYYRPRVDKALLAEHHRGLIVLSGCLNGELPTLLAEKRAEEARRVALAFRDIFEDDFYLELQRHPGITELEEVNRSLFALNRELGMPLVATNDFHYVRQEDASLQDILICIHTNTSINDAKRLKMADDSFYLKSPEEMKELFQDVPEALANTERIAQQCNVQLGFSQLHLPKYPTPGNQKADDYLEALCKEGFQRRLPQGQASYRQRLAYELEVIRLTRFADYFLVVWDIASFARSRGILFGIRGSAAASLVLYCLDVTDVDPLEHRLVFERFLNKERKEMPDIDMDFQDDRRDEVLQYLAGKYGPKHMAQIITFGTMGPKAATRDVGRALALSYADVDRVARLVPFRARSLDEAMEMTPELHQLYEADPTLRRLIDTARQLEGVVHHASTHAAGVVISGEPLTEYVPLQRGLRGEAAGLAMTQYAMDPIAKLGLLKMDVLGLTNLTILQKAIETLDHDQGIRLDLHRIPLDDAKTFDLLSSGETGEVFQLESAGMRRYIKELKPTAFADIAAMVALYRPGPMEHITTYIDAKHQRAAIRYPHPALRELLEDTYGVIVYQDQVLLIVQAFAGYSLGEADVVRKAMGKKIPAVMRQEQQRFVRGALARGFTAEEAEAVFHLIEPFAGYAFNKAHSVSYALIAYWTAYFKANYPLEYMASVLNTRLGSLERAATAVAECHRLGIPVLPPDVNRSDVGFTIEGQPDGGRSIRFGLAAVKNVGMAWVRPVTEARLQGGPFRSIDDFCRRAELSGANRRGLESLIKVGAFDALGVERSSLLAGLDRFLSLAQREARLRRSGQATMFDLLGQTVEAPLPQLDLPPKEPPSPREKVAWERELLGVALSDNPFGQELASLGGSGAILSVHDLDPAQSGQRVVLLGQLASVRQGFTRERRPFIAAMVALLGGEVEVVAWPNVLETSQELWVEGAALWIIGRIRMREERLTVVCEEVKPYHPQEELPYPEPEPASRTAPRSPQEDTNGRVDGEPQATLLLTIQETENAQKDEQRLREVLRVLLEFPGQDRVLLEVQGKDRKVRLDAQITTGSSPELLARLEEVLEPGTMRIEELA